MDAEGPLVQREALLQPVASVSSTTQPFHRPPCFDGLHAVQVNELGYVAAQTGAPPDKLTFFGRSSSQESRLFRFSGVKFFCCLLVVCGSVWVGHQMFAALQTSANSLRLSECASAYYAAAACLLGGQKLDAIAPDSIVWQHLYTALLPESVFRAKLQAMLASKAFQEGSRCPRWSTWSNGQCVTANASCDGNQELGVGARQDCGGNVFKQRTSGEWSGLCTCPDGTEYVAGDNDDGCMSIACFGGNATSECSPRGQRSKISNLHQLGQEVVCWPDFLTGAALLGRANPANDVECWTSCTGGCQPQYMSSRFAKSTVEKPTMHFPRGQWINVVTQSEAFSINANPIVGRLGDFQERRNSFPREWRNTA